MTEPIKNRDTAALHGAMRSRVESYVAALNQTQSKYTVSVGETLRTSQRQQWLYSQNTRTRWVTNCDGVHSLSTHQFGLAADLVVTPRNNPRLAVWDARIWRWLYSLVPPSQHGLELIPQELVHVQALGAMAHTMANGAPSEGFINSVC